MLLIETNLKMHESFFFQIQYVICTFLCGDLQLSNTPSISCHIYMLIDHINNSLMSSFSFRFVDNYNKNHIYAFSSRCLNAVTKLCVVLLYISAKQKPSRRPGLVKEHDLKMIDPHRILEYA